MRGPEHKVGKENDPLQDDQVLSLSPARVKKMLLRVNPHKASGPDNIPGQAPKACVDQLSDILTNIFNTSQR